MDRETATRIRDLVQKGGENIRESIDLVRGQLPDDVFKNYCRVVGTIVADTQLEFVRTFTKSILTSPKPPSDPDGQELLKRLEPEFADLAERARRESESE